MTPLSDALRAQVNAFDLAWKNGHRTFAIRVLESFRLTLRDDPHAPPEAWYALATIEAQIENFLAAGWSLARMFSPTLRECCTPEGVLSGHWLNRQAFLRTPALERAVQFVIAYEEALRTLPMSGIYVVTSIEPPAGLAPPPIPPSEPEPDAPLDLETGLRQAEVLLDALLSGATAGPWTDDEDEAMYRLHGSAGPAGGTRQILKAAKTGTPYAEYWPCPADAALLRAAPSLRDALQNLVLLIRETHA